MTPLAIVYRMARVAFSWIRPRFDRVKEPEIAPVHLLLNGVAPLVAIDAKHRVAVAPKTALGILFSVKFVFGNPVCLMALRFGKLTSDMADLTVLSGGERRIGIVVAGVATETVDLFVIFKRLRIGVAEFALDVSHLKKSRVHFVAEKFKRVLPLLSLGEGRKHKQQNETSCFNLHDRNDNQS